jgi:sugar phosphate isomerase/epimerase
MDIGWLTVAGQDPVSYFNRYPGRFPLVHVKDMSKLPKISPDTDVSRLPHQEIEIADVGAGLIDWKKIFASADKAGIQHYFVEHDSPKDAFASITNSYDYLSKLRF